MKNKMRTREVLNSLGDSQRMTEVFSNGCWQEVGFRSTQKSDGTWFHAVGKPGHGFQDWEVDFFPGMNKEHETLGEFMK
jgi:hypothetical protein